MWLWVCVCVFVLPYGEAIMKTTSTQLHTMCWWSEAAWGGLRSVSINPVTAMLEVRQWLLPGVTDRANQLPERCNWCRGLPSRDGRHGDGTRRPVSLKLASEQMLWRTPTPTHTQTLLLVKLRRRSCRCRKTETGREKRKELKGCLFLKLKKKSY